MKYGFMFNCFCLRRFICVSSVIVFYILKYVLRILNFFELGTLTAKTLKDSSTLVTAHAWLDGIFFFIFFIHFSSSSILSCIAAALPMAVDIALDYFLKVSLL